MSFHLTLIIMKRKDFNQLNDVLFLALYKEAQRVLHMNYVTISLRTLIFH